MFAAKNLPVVPMNRQQIESFLVSLPEIATIEIDTFTVPPMKKPCPFPNVFKLTTRLIEVGKSLNYTEHVKANQEVEGRVPDFVPSQPTFGKQIDGTPLQEHNGKIYLPCVVLKTFAASFVNANFTKIRTDLLVPYLRQTPEVKSQPTSAKVVYRKYLIDSIMAIRYNGIELKAV